MPGKDRGIISWKEGEPVEFISWDKVPESIKEILDIEFRESAITSKLLIADMTKDQMEVLEEYTVVPPSSKMWPELEKLAQELEMNDKANKDKEELIRQHRIIKPISLEIEDGVKNYITLIREAQEKQEEYFN